MGTEQTAGRAGASIQDLSRLITPPGEWSVQHQPAVAGNVLVVKAAGATGIRHVAKSITVSVASGATPQAIVVFVLRDGLTGAGPIIWSCAIACVAGTSQTIALVGLNLVGSAATAMTLENSSAISATCQAVATLSGYSVGG